MGTIVVGYFDDRLKLGHGVTVWRSQWRGLVQLVPVFLTNDGRPFKLTTRKTAAGNMSRSCESLSALATTLTRDESTSSNMPRSCARILACTKRMRV